MKNNSQKMFRYGNIANLVYFIVAVCFIPLGIALVAINSFMDPPKPEMVEKGGKLIGFGVYFLIATILCFIFVKKAQKDAADENNKSLSPYIMAIVFGAISENPFYVLAGIFGLIAQSKENNGEAKEEPKQVEEKKEESKEE